MGFIPFPKDFMGLGTPQTGHGNKTTAVRWGEDIVAVPMERLDQGEGTPR